MEGLADVISNLTSVFTAIIGWAGSVGETIVSTPILLVVVSVPIVGAGVGFFRRLLRIR